MGQAHLPSLDINDCIYELKSKTHFVLDKGYTLLLWHRIYTTYPNSDLEYNKFHPFQLRLLQNKQRNR